MIATSTGKGSIHVQLTVNGAVLLEGDIKGKFVTNRIVTTVTNILDKKKRGKKLINAFSVIGWYGSIFLKNLF